MTVTQTQTRDQLPEAGEWQLDTAHTTVGFVARHLMVSKVRGHFGSYTGSIVIGEDPADSSVNVTIDASSITTGDEKRDEHLRSADFFDVASHPAITFRSTKLSGAGEDWKVEGELTIRGITKPVVLDVELGGSTTNPWGAQVAAFSASTEIDREEWGLTWNAPLEAGGVLVSKKIKIEIETELNKS